MPFSFRRLEIPDVLLITPNIFEDERGFFMETYKLSEFKKLGVEYNFVQENFAKSKKNVLRGLHYQLEPKSQGKLVRCVRGKVWDVAVDIRKGSPWYGKWVKVEMSEENKNILWVPRGFAHGYVSVEEDSEILYLTTEEYAPQFERGILWNDPTLKIDWGVDSPIVSQKDGKLPLLEKTENNFVYWEKTKDN